MQEEYKISVKNMRQEREGYRSAFLSLTKDIEKVFNSFIMDKVIIFIFMFIL